MKKKWLRMLSWLLTACLLVGIPKGNVQAETVGGTHEHVAKTEKIPTCQEGGSIEYQCEVSGCDAISNLTTAQLSHAGFAVAKLSWAYAAGWLITKPGQDVMTPFKFLDFGEGEFCEIEFYVYNATSVTLNTLSLCYQYGTNAYASEADASAKKTIEGTSVTLGLAPNTGTIVTLKIPRECYFSNSPGKLTAGSADSLGKLVSYRDMGLRFRGASNIQKGEAVYAACLSDSRVTEMLSRSTNYSPGTTQNELITSTENVPEAVAVALNSYYGNAECVHCKETADTHTYEEKVVTVPTCEVNGNIQYVCTKCRDIKHLSTTSLGHNKFAVAKMSWACAAGWLITKPGQDVITPFKFLDFGNDEFCDVELYIYNATSVVMNTLSLSYQYGTNAYASETDATAKKAIEGTSVQLTLAPNTGKTVTLKIPRECYFSNSPGKLTAGSADSLGELVSYRDMGLRFRGASNIPKGESVYVACLSDSRVTEMLTRSTNYSPSTTQNELITSTASVPERVAKEMTEWYGDIECVHCDEPQGSNSGDDSDIPAGDIGVVKGNAETWVSKEIIFKSTKEYTDPYNEVELDLEITTGTGDQAVTYKIPAFWDGGSIWRARFACPTAGEWTFRTVCSDTENAGLHNITGTFACVEYTGDLDIYKKGFVKTTDDLKYFTYADGTPFFYMGDTHWSLGTETVDMVKTICQDRVDKGFTVYQSEPIGAAFNLVDGISQSDMKGFEDYDEKFQVIADSGLVHANAEFFFISNTNNFINNHGGWDISKVYATADHRGTEVPVYDLSDEAKEALERLARYWVARYGSYPVMWTLAQEVDNDFYWDNEDYNSHSEWSYLNNPWVYVAEYIGKYDPYAHPLSAHMENGATTPIKDSAFREVEEHTWYATQWSQNLNVAPDVNRTKEYWENSKGKPVVYYEGKYCYLWTKNFGARVQGWMAYLNGMFGASWGGQDTWSYLNGYNENVTNVDGVDVILPADKQSATWESSLYYPSAYQMGYMKDFMEDIVCDWWNLIPRFDDVTYFEPANNRVFGIHASNQDKSKNVIYFYNFSDESLAKIPNATAENAVKTGKLNNMQPNATYNYIWYNPVYGQIVERGILTADAAGVLSLPEKDTCDMTLYVTLAKEGCAHTSVHNYAEKAASCTQFGNNAYSYCPDCNTITSDNYVWTDVLAHTPDKEASCTSNANCTVCKRIISDVSGHVYDEVAITDVDCEASGKISYQCAACKLTKEYQTTALTHEAFGVAKIDWRAGYWYNILQYGQEENTPFKFMDFGDGETCDIKLYIYNHSGSPLDEVAISYKWGAWVYADQEAAARGERVEGTYVGGLDLKAGESTIITLTIPKELCVSNSKDSMSDYANDTMGEAVSYRELSLRFNKEEKASDPEITQIYVACLSDSSVTEMLGRTRRMTDSNKSNEYITDSTQVPDKVASDLEDIYGDVECVHCDGESSEGYSAGLDSLTGEVMIGKTVNVNVAVDHSDDEVFAAGEIVLTYDSAKLTFNKDKSELNGATVTENPAGTLTLEDYGKDKDFGNAVYVLAFDAKADGEAAVEIASAAFVNKEDAVKSDLIAATISPAEITLTVNKTMHNVTLPEGFSGDATVTDGDAYTFSVSEDGAYFEYGEVTATVDGTPVDVTKNPDGTYTIAEVTGVLVISSTRTAKSFDVTIEGTGANDIVGAASKATYGTDYTFTMPTADGFAYQLESLKIGGVDVTGESVYEVNPDTNQCTIHGSTIKGAIVMSISKTATKAGVTVTGSGASAAAGYNVSATIGADYTLTIVPESGWTYVVTATMNGETAVVIDSENNTYTIEDVTGPIVFTVERILKADGIEVTDYLTIDSSNIWLVKYAVTVDEGKVPTYDSNNMFWSDKYQAYCYLVIADTISADDVTGKVNIANGTAVEVDYGMDVNKSGKVDASDAQLTYNIYNAMYSEFTQDVTVEKFLRADVNGDAKVNVEDAAAIITDILK